MNKSRFKKLRPVILLATLGLASVAQASPIYTFASFSTIGVGMSLVNVTVTGAFLTGNGGLNPNPCGSGVANCLFLVSGAAPTSGAPVNRTINSTSTWNVVSTMVGLGPDKLFDTADDSLAATNAIFLYDPTQIAGNFSSPTLAAPVVFSEFRMAVRSLTPIVDCTSVTPTCLQHFNTGYIDFRLTAADLADVNTEDPDTIGTTGSLLHVDVTTLGSDTGGTYGGMKGTRNTTSNIGFQGDTEDALDVFLFSSDYLDFGTQDRSTMSWSATVIDPCLTRNQASTADCRAVAPSGGNYLHSARFSGLTGSFGANPQPISIYTNIPEPGGWILSVTGLALIGLAFIPTRRRKITQ